jgi:hypothetical protein
MSRSPVAVRLDLETPLLPLPRVAPQCAVPGFNEPGMAHLREPRTRDTDTTSDERLATGHMSIQPFTRALFRAAEVIEFGGAGCDLGQGTRRPQWSRRVRDDDPIFRPSENVGQI